MNKEKLITFSQDLVKLKSLSGKEDGVAKRIVKEMKYLGYDEVTIDSYGNVIGKIKGNGKKTILFEGHMDIVDVPTPEDWSVDPFGGVIKDGCLYGRGAADMKSALAAMIYGVSDLINSKDIADIYVVAVVYEEIFEGVGFGKVLDKIKPDAVVLGEPNNLEIAIGQKGRAEIIVETIGVNAHSAHPEVGVNAINNIIPLMNEINNIPKVESEKLGKGILVTTDILSSPYPGASIIPDRCRATIDRRLIEGETHESVIAPIKDVINKLSKKDSSFKAEVKYSVEELPTYTNNTLKSERFYPGWVLSESDILVESAKKVYNKLGLESVISKYLFCTDGSESAGKRGIPTIGIGPAFAEMAHVVDENVKISKIISAAEIYKGLASEF